MCTLFLHHTPFSGGLFFMQINCGNIVDKLLDGRLSYYLAKLYKNIKKINHCA